MLLSAWKVLVFLCGGSGVSLMELLGVRPSDSVLAQVVWLRACALPVVILARFCLRG